MTTPSARRRKLLTLANRLRGLADDVESAARHDDPLTQLVALHGTAHDLAEVRERFADGKGAAAATAKQTNTHEQIARALSVSKPYVQQMVYRGRTEGSE